LAKRNATKNLKDSPPDLETALKELETLIEHMEAGELSLEESLKCFERGTALVRHCQQALDTAEQKVQILLEADEQTKPQDFGTPDAS